jgi:hypothetical protein
MHEDLHEHKCIEIYNFWLRTRSHVTSHYTILEVCWDGIWTLSFGLSQLYGHGFWLVCEVAMNGKNRPLVTDKPVEFEK